MDSSSSAEKQLSQNNSLDSGFSEDIRMPPVENMPSCSKVEYAGAESNLDKILQLRSSAVKRENKKRKLEEDEPGYSRTQTLTSRVYLEHMSILRSLNEKEKKLKIGLEYVEKLRRKQQIILDTDVLSKRIVECQKTIQELRRKIKMQNVMCVNLQLADTMLRIVRKQKKDNFHKTTGFTYADKMRIELLLKMKKDLSRRIGIQRQKVAEMDESILKLEKHYSANEQIGSKPMADCGSSNASTNADELKKLQRLKKNNEKTANRIHLLSGIMQNLTNYIGKKRRAIPKIAILMTECKKVSECQFHDISQINELLKSVGSLNL